jgi:hypothetical protein
MSTTLDTIQRKLDEMTRRIPAPLQAESRGKFVEVQSKAERVFQALGDSAPVPAFVEGETVAQYRQRLLRTLKDHSPRWKSVDLSLFAGDALDQVEHQVYADAMAGAYDPSTVPAGTLREMIETDRTGRRISRFVGDPSACWDIFKQPARNVTGWNTK